MPYPYYGHGGVVIFAGLRARVVREGEFGGETRGHHLPDVDARVRRSRQSDTSEGSTEDVSTGSDVDCWARLPTVRWGKGIVTPASS